jgi:hypothetical protein
LTDNTLTAPPPAALKKHPLLRRELQIGGCALLAGLLLLPLLIYVTGRLTLGPYGPGGLGAFLKDFFFRLVRGSAPTWGVVVGPYLLLAWFRAAVLVYRRYIRRS